MLYNVWYHSSIPRCTIPCNNPVLLVGWILLYMPPYRASASASLPSPFWNKKQVWQAWKRDREGRRCQRALNVAPNEPCRERSSLELGTLSQIRIRLTKNTLRIADSVWGMLTIMRAYFPHQLQPRHSDQSLDTNLMIERVNINHPWFLRNHDRATPNRME